MSTVTELKALLKIKDETIAKLQKLLTEKEQTIEQLRSQLDKFQSVFPKAIPRKQRAQGISAEPQSAKTIQDYLTNNAQKKYAKSER